MSRESVEYVCGLVWIDTNVMILFGTIMCSQKTVSVFVKRYGAIERKKDATVKKVSEKEVKE